MEAGLAAPSGCNKQTTSLIAIDDPEVLKKVVSLIDPPLGETAPAMICVLTQKIIAYRDRCYNVEDFSAAIENMLLAAVALGYESCWIQGHITDVDMIGKKWLTPLAFPTIIRLSAICLSAQPTRNASERLKSRFPTARGLTALRRTRHS